MPSNSNRLGGTTKNEQIKEFCADFRVLSGQAEQADIKCIGEEFVVVVLLILLIALVFLILAGFREYKSSLKKPSKSSGASQRPRDIEDKWR